MNNKTIEEMADVTSSVHYCPQCGSSETELVMRRVGTEKLTLLLFPLFIVIGVALGYLIFIIGLALIDTFGLGNDLGLLGCAASFMLTIPVGGIILARTLGRALIRRSRRKNNLSQTTCRCKMCKKIFIPEIQ